MRIREMNRDECLQVLARAKVARLGCALDNQPYIVPISVAYHQSFSGEACLYGFTTLGRKIAWMRANPLVCVEVDEVVAHDQWVSVIAMGHYEELLEASQRDGAPCDAMASDAERLAAWRVLQRLPAWWQPGGAVWAARPHDDAVEPFIAVYYKIRLGHVTGHEAIPETLPAPSHVDHGWLHRALSRVFGGSATGAGSAC